jgi:hypothetical protein
MKSLRAGQLVTVTDDDGAVDAIVSDTSHLPRVVVVAMDADGEAAFRTVHLGRLRPRADAGEHDHAFRQLISAASAEARAGAPGSNGGVLKGRPAHSGPRMHRPTGRGA